MALLRQLPAMACLGLASLQLGATDLVDEVELVRAKEPRWGGAPLVYFSDYTGWTVAGGVGTQGWRDNQEQEAWAIGGFVGSNRSRGLWLFGLDSRLGERWFLDTQLHWSWLRNIESYRDGNPRFADEVAGSHDSSADNFVNSQGEEGYANFEFKYILPIGAGRDSIIHRYQLQRGLLMPATALARGPWNPLHSGRTIFSIEPFWRHQVLGDEFTDGYDRKTVGTRFKLEYDNTDWHKRPSEGSTTLLTVTRDWGGQESDSPWTRWKLQYGKYLPLGPSRYALNRVLALGAMITDTPSWDRGERPPIYERASLGGWYHQRAYNFRRFHSRSALNYSAEFRYTPSWNPLPGWPLLKLLPHFLWEWTGFVEAGRVHDRFDLGELHRDMNWNIGAGLRFSLRGAVLRIDAAAGEDAASVWVSAGYPW